MNKTKKNKVIKNKTFKNNKKKNIIIIEHPLNFYYRKNNTEFRNFLKKSFKNYNLFFVGNTNIIDQINKLNNKENINGIINFEETYDPRYLFRFDKVKTIKELYDYFNSLKIKIYPSAFSHFMTDSKQIYYYIYKHFPKFLLKDTKVLIADKEDNMLEKFKDDVFSIKTEKVIVKLGYSGEANDVFFIEKSFDHIKKIYSKIQDFIKKHDVKLPIIIQPYNPIVKSRLNEYRCFVINGIIIDHFAQGIIRESDNKIVKLPSIPFDNKNEDHKNIKNISIDIYNSLNKTIFKEDPIIYLRVDVSYYIENDIKKWYINEIENLDGTFYFNLPPSNKENTFEFQNKLALALKNIF